MTMTTTLSHRLSRLILGCAAALLLAAAPRRCTRKPSP
jgi:hypothetical protein